MHLVPPQFSSFWQKLGCKCLVVHGWEFWKLQFRYKFISKYQRIPPHTVNFINSAWRECVFWWTQVENVCFTSYARSQDNTYELRFDVMNWNWNMKLNDWLCAFIASLLSVQVRHHAGRLQPCNPGPAGDLVHLGPDCCWSCPSVCLFQPTGNSKETNRHQKATRIWSQGKRLKKIVVGFTSHVLLLQ